MNIQLNDDQLQKAVSDALVLALPDEARKAIIAEALRWLTEPRKDGYYGTKASPLQEAFNQAISQAASRIFDDEFRNPDSEASMALHELVNQAIVKMKDEESYKNLGGQFAEALAKVLSGSSY